MTKNYPQQVIGTLADTKPACVSTGFYTGCHTGFYKHLTTVCKHLVTVLLMIAFTRQVSAQITLAPYNATYASDITGLPTQLTRQLLKTDNGHWLLSNRTSIFFTDLKEQATFSIHNNRLKPFSYDYQNPLSSKRNSSLRFNWKNNTVSEKTTSTPPLTVPDDALDKLTFQLQLRLDLIKMGSNFKEKNYTLVDRNRLKHYTINYLGHEVITTEAGKFAAVKLKQQRPGKKKYTLIWLARDWQYFILRIERFEQGKSLYSLQLQSASIDGQKIVAKTLTDQHKPPVQ